MAKRKGKPMFNACDTCGAIGYLKELVLCCHCKNSFRHSYCMADMHFVVTMPWSCNDCPHSLNVDQEQEEIMLDNKDFDAEDSNRMKTLLPLGNEAQAMANKLTSKVPVNSAKHDKQSNRGVSGTTRPADKKVANASTYSASLLKHSDTAPSQKMAPLSNPRYSKEKFVNCHDQPCWKGTFEILDGNFLLPPYQGLRAHLSCDVNTKVVDLCKSLSEKLEFKELPLSKVWPKIFMLEPPNTDDVALYFFCVTGRTREKYIRLVQRLDSRDHALKAKMKGAQLLLFSSKKLPPNSNKTKHMSYLWGIIRFLKSKVVLKNTNVKSTNITPKTQKQIRFDLSNLPREKKSADFNLNAKKNAPKSCLVKQQMNVQIQTDSEKGNILKNKDVINKVTNISLDSDIPPGFSYPSSAFPKSSLTNISDNLTDQDVQLRTDCDKGNIEKNNGIINKPTNINVDPDIPPGFSYPSSAFVKSSLANTATNHTDQDICIGISSPLHSRPKEVDMSIENTNIQMENSDMSIDSEDEEIKKSSMPNVAMPYNSSAIKKDLLIPNIGPPPGFPEIPIKLAKCIVGAEMNNCFIKTEGYMESIGAPPGFPEIAVKRPFVLPIECCECLLGVKNGTCAVGSDVKVDKVNIKKETCLEDINFVEPNFVQSPLSKDATSTMIKCQNAPIVCAKASDSENKSGENSNNQSPISSANKENNFISPNSAEECNKFKFTLENGCKSYDNNLSWMNKTMKTGIPNDAENGIFRSNAKAQSENSGKISGKNMFKFSLKKTDKPSASLVPTCFENPSKTDSEITKGNRATGDKQATEEKSGSRSSQPPTEQCSKNHYISKNPALTLPASSAEKARDVSSRTTNPESASEVRRILLEVKKSRELKGKI